jgi:hypothetical protein
MLESGGMLRVPLRGVAFLHSSFQADQENNATAQLSFHDYVD